MTKLEFGQTIKQKYPQYQNVSDAELADMVLSKYPQYQVEIQDSSTPEGQLPNNPVDFIAGTVKNIPKSAWENTKQIGGAIANVFNPDPEQNTLRNLAELTYEIDPFTGGLNQRLHGMNPERDKLNSLKNYFGSRYGVTDEQGRFDPSLERLGQTVYNDPVGVAMDVAPIAGAGSKVLQGTKAGKALNVVSKLDPVEAVSSGAGRVFGKAGRGIESGGSQIRRMSTGATSPQARDFAAATGQALPDFLRKENLAGRGTTRVEGLIDDAQTAYDASARASGVSIPESELLRSFDEEIAAIRDKGVMTSEDAKVLNRLQAEREFIQPQIARGDVPVGQVTDLKSSYFKQSRGNRGVVPSKAKFQENLAQGMNRTLERQIPGIKDQGKRLQKLREYEKIARSNLDKGRTGNPIKMSTLVAGSAGGAAAGIPGAIIGAAGEMILNNPRTASIASRAIEKAGQGLQGVGKSKIGSVFKKATKAVSPFRGQLDKEREKVKAKSPNLRGYSR